MKIPLSPPPIREWPAFSSARRSSGWKMTTSTSRPLSNTVFSRKNKVRMFNTDGEDRKRSIARITMPLMSCSARESRTSLIKLYTTKATIRISRVSVRKLNCLTKDTI